VEVAIPIYGSEERNFNALNECGDVAELSNFWIYEHHVAPIMARGLRDSLACAHSGFFRVG
jgi:hypothetical protein